MTRASTPVLELAQDPFSVIAHRGGMPGEENTRRAFDHALQQGVRWLETDVYQTPSGLVAFHDPDLTRLAGEESMIWDMTSDMRDFIARKEGGVRIPLFRELLDLVPSEATGQIVWNIDCKRPEAVEPLLELLRERKLFGSVVLASFDQETADRLRELAPDRTATALTFDESVKLGLGALTKAPADIVFAQLPVTGLFDFGNGEEPIPVLSETTSVIADARRLKLAGIHAWGERGYLDEVDSPEGIRHLIELEIDGVITNDVETAQQAVAEAFAGSD